MDKQKKFRRILFILLMFLILTVSFGNTVLALDNTDTIGSGTTDTVDAFYYSDQYMWKVSLFVAKTDKVNRNESNISDFHRIGSESIYLSPVSNWNQWEGGSRPSHISSLMFSKENKVDTLMELEKKNNNVSALDPVTLTNAGGIKWVYGMPEVNGKSLPYPPQMCDGMIFKNGVIQEPGYVGKLENVTEYFSSQNTIYSILKYYAAFQGKSPEQLVSELEFTINGETRTGWNPEGILPKEINGNPTNQVEWLIVYEPCTVVYTRDTSKWKETDQWYNGYVLSATDFSVMQIKKQMDWRYDETRMSSWVGKQPDAWLPNAQRQHVARLSHLVVGNSVLIKDPWYGYEVGKGVDQNAAVPYNRWTSENQLKFGGWGMSMWEKPATYKEAIDYDFNENTDVIYATNIYSNIDTVTGDELTVTYEINGGTYTNTVIAPKKTEVLSYFKWHTPEVDTPTTYDLKITVSPYPKGTIGADGNEYVHKTITVRPLVEKTPPDPKVHDTLPTDFLKDNVPDLVVGDDTIKKTDTPTVEEVQEVSKAPYYYDQKVTLNIITNRVTQAIDFKNIKTGDSRQLTKDSVGNGILVSTFENKLDDTITWQVEFTMINFGKNTYSVVTSSAEKGLGSEFQYSLDMLEDPDIPIIFSVDIKPKPDTKGFYYLYTDTKSPDLEYMVYYNTDEGTIIDSHKIKANTLLPQPTEPVKEGFDFAGWYKDNNFTELFDFNMPIRGVTTLYSKWTIKTFSVSFDSNGKGNAIAPISVKFNEIIPEPTKPGQDGFKFEGWYKDSSLTEKWDFDNYTVTQDTILYAKWSANEFLVGFEENGGTDVVDQVIKYNERIVEPTIQRDGYSFEGWFKDKDFTKRWDFENDTVTDNLVLYAKWKANPSIIQFEENGGSIISDMTGVTDQEITDTTMPVTNRDGYSFKGWFEQTDFSGDEITALPAKYPVDGITYYAKWEANKSVIAFEENGDTPVADLVGVTDQEITEPTMPTITRSGYSFKGWFEQSDFSGDEITALPAKYPIDGTTYYAKWEANESVIVFEENGGSPVADLVGVTDQEITEPTMPTITRNGYSFKGWFEQSDFSGDEITALPAKYPIDGTTYYAKWEANESVIMFEENGGSPVADLVGVTDQEITDTTMPNTNREGYTFDGWFEQSDFAGDEISALPAKYPIIGITYYAKWLPIPYTLSFDSQSGSVVASQTVNYDEFGISPASPSLSGFTFTGWYKESECTNKWDFSVDKVKSDTTLYAGWVFGIPGPEVPLEYWSWEQIKYVADRGLGETYFDVAEEKNITLSTGEILTLQIYGFNHDPLADGTGNKTNITFGLKYLMKDKRQMNGTNTNVGGWNGSGMRSWTNGSLFDSLASDLQGAISIVDKPTAGGTNNTSIVNSADKLFMFSDEELFMNNDIQSLAGEGSQYTIFSDNKAASKIKSINGVKECYWLRSAGLGSSTFYYETDNGSPGLSDYYYGVASLPQGVNFGFAVGNALTNTYTVTYDSKGGSAVASASATLNTTISAPTDPTKSEYTFGGWYKDSACTSKFTFGTDKIVGNTSLYAKWQATVTFDSMGGDSVSSLITNLNTTIAQPATPSRSGYVFKGWFNESGCLSEFNFSTEQITKNKTLYAKWSLGVPDSSVPLNDWSWEQIKIVADAGLGQSYFDVGEYKDITLSTGEVLRLQIYGFNHDELADGTGNKTNITFGLKNLMAETTKMYNLASTTDAAYASVWTSSYAGSDLKKYLNLNVYPTLPNDLKTVISTTKKYTAQTEWNIVASSEILFPFSAIECGNGVYTYPGEGTQYQIFNNVSNRTKKLANGTGAEYPWWTRSPLRVEFLCEWAAFSTGGVVNTFPRTLYGVNFGFAIGNAPTNTYTVAFDSQGGSAVSSKTATINTTITAPTEPTKTNAFFGGWYKDAGCTQSWNFSTDKVTGATTLYAKWTDLPPAGQPLESYTWPQIKQISEAGKADDYWNVGDEKKVKLWGSDYVFQIYGFNHDDKADGSGKAGITFGSKNIITTMGINSSDTPGVYYGNSTLRAYLQSDIYNNLEESLKAGIKTVKKYSSQGFDSSSGNIVYRPLVSSSETLFLFSDEEVIDNYILNPSGEGNRYSIFDNIANTRKGGIWWTRTYANWWVYVREDDTFGSNCYAFEPRGVVFGFCI